MITEPSAELADKTRAYLTAHGWACGGDGEAGALWTAPDGRQVAVPHWLAEDDPMFRHLLTVVAYIEYRQALAVAADVIGPAGSEPAFTLARPWTWTRVEGTDVEILADTEVRLCARQAAGIEQEIRARIAADLRRAAEGRLEYAGGAVTGARGHLMLSAEAYESAAAIVEDPMRLLGVIPSWRWTAEEHASVTAGTPPVLDVTRDRHCGHCGRDNAMASACETPLCHTDDPGLPDCYRRVTVYAEPVGALLGVAPKPSGVEGIIR